MMEKPLLLAIDTATRFAGLALYDGDTILAESCWLSKNNHSVELMPALTRMLEQQTFTAGDLAAVAVSIGPGSFTGLRIGLSTAKGLAKAAEIPILGIPTLDIFTVLGSQRTASPLTPESKVQDRIVVPSIDRMLNFRPREHRRTLLAVIQAGRGRFCAAQYAFRKEQWEQHGGLHLTTLDGLAQLVTGRTLVCGELSKEEMVHLSKHAQADVVFATASQTMRRPACLAELAWQRFKRGEQDDLASLSPIYLKSTPS
jgi:tRNA threonylcarbamoyladenosine biosynthesis protein TsaB